MNTVKKNFNQDIVEKQDLLNYTKTIQKQSNTINSQYSALNIDSKDKISPDTSQDNNHSFYNVKQQVLPQDMSFFQNTNEISNTQRSDINHISQSQYSNEPFPKQTLQIKNIIPLTFSKESEEQQLNNHMEKEAFQRQKWNNNNKNGFNNKENQDTSPQIKYNLVDVTPTLQQQGQEQYQQCNISSQPKCIQLKLEETYSTQENNLSQIKQNIVNLQNQIEDISNKSDLNQNQFQLTQVQLEKGKQDIDEMMENIQKQKDFLSSQKKPLQNYSPYKQSDPYKNNLDTYNGDLNKKKLYVEDQKNTSQIDISKTIQNSTIYQQPQQFTKNNYHFVQNEQLAKKNPLDNPEISVNISQQNLSRVGSTSVINQSSVICKEDMNLLRLNEENKKLESEILSVLEKAEGEPHSQRSELKQILSITLQHLKYFKEQAEIAFIELEQKNFNLQIELKDKTQQISEQKSQNKIEHQTFIDQKQKELQKINESQDQLHQQINDLKKENYELSQTKYEQVQKLDKFQESEQCLQTENEKLLQIIKEKDEEIDKLAKENSHKSLLELQIQDMNKLQDSLERVEKDRELEKSMFQKEKQSYIQMLEKCEENISNYLQEIDSLKEQIQNVQREKEELNLYNENLNKQSEKQILQEEQIIGLKQQISEKENQISSKEIKIQQFQSIINQKDEDYLIIQQKLLQPQQNTVKSTLLQSLGIFYLSEEQIEKCVNDLQQKVSSSEKEITEIKEKIPLAQQEIKQILSMNTNLQEKLIKEKSGREISEQQNRTLQRNKEILEQTNTDLLKTNTQLQEEVKKVQETLQFVQNQNENIKNISLQKNQNYSKFQEERHLQAIKQLTLLNKKLNQENEELKKSLNYVEKIEDYFINDYIKSKRSLPDSSTDLDQNSSQNIKAMENNARINIGSGNISSNSNSDNLRKQVDQLTQDKVEQQQQINELKKFVNQLVNFKNTNTIE